MINKQSPTSKHNNKKMNIKKINKKDKFSEGIFVIAISILLFAMAFMSEENKITGFAVSDTEINANAIEDALASFENVDSLTLGAGLYYVDGNGIVYWLDDDSNPAVAKVKFVDETQKNKVIYIDDEGRIGYILTPILINNN